MQRNDLLPQGEAPKYVKDFLARFGGRNLYGEPIYRFVLAQCVRTFEAGTWHDWDDNASVQERGGICYDEAPGGLNYAGPHPNKPLRVVTETRWTERYPNLEGWVLQRWHPAHFYGSPDAWRKNTVANRSDLCVLGPFPETGAYELAVEKPYPHIPSLSRIENAVLILESRLTELLGTKPEERRQKRLDEYHRRESKRVAERRVIRSQMIREHMSPYWGSSLAAGRLREQLARRAGMTSHVGN